MYRLTIKQSRMSSIGNYEVTEEVVFESDNLVDLTTFIEKAEQFNMPNTEYKIEKQNIQIK